MFPFVASNYSHMLVYFREQAQERDDPDTGEARLWLGPHQSMEGSSAEVGGNVASSDGFCVNTDI